MNDLPLRLQPKDVIWKTLRREVPIIIHGRHVHHFEKHDGLAPDASDRVVQERIAALQRIGYLPDKDEHGQVLIEPL